MMSPEYARKTFTPVTWQDRLERIPADYDLPSENELFAKRKEGERLTAEAAKWGMKVGDWELLDRDEQNILMDFEELIETN